MVQWNRGPGTAFCACTRFAVSCCPRPRPGYYGRYRQRRTPGYRPGAGAKPRRHGLARQWKWRFRVGGGPTGRFRLPSRRNGSRRRKQRWDARSRRHHPRQLRRGHPARRRQERIQDGARLALHGQCRCQSAHSRLCVRRCEQGPQSRHHYGEQRGQQYRRSLRRWPGTVHTGAGFTVCRRSEALSFRSRGY